MTRIFARSQSDGDYLVILIPTLFDEEGLPDGEEPFFFAGVWAKREVAGTLTIDDRDDKFYWLRAETKVEGSINLSIGHMPRGQPGGMVAARFKPDSIFSVSDGKAYAFKVESVKEV